MCTEASDCVTVNTIIFGSGPKLHVDVSKLNSFPSVVKILTLKSFKVEKVSFKKLYIHSPTRYRNKIKIQDIEAAYMNISFTKGKGEPNF